MYHTFNPCVTVPASSPSEISPSLISATGFQLSWSSPPPEDHNGIIRYYTVNVTEENTGRKLQFETPIQSVTLEFLHPFYNYTCVVSAATVGPGPYSSPLTVSTLEAGR